MGARKPRSLDEADRAFLALLEKDHWFVKEARELVGEILADGGDFGQWHDDMLEALVWDAPRIHADNAIPDYISGLWRHWCEGTDWTGIATHFWLAAGGNADGSASDSVPTDG